jgi:hypothetical protein
MNPRPCNDAKLIADHLEAFVKNFVVAAKRERIKGKLLKLDGNEWDKLAPDLRNWLDLKKCVELRGQNALPTWIIERLGNREGLYYDFESLPHFLKLNEAIDSHFRDAIFSIDAGKLVVILTHHDEILVCGSVPV